MFAVKYFLGIYSWQYDILNIWLWWQWLHIICCPPHPVHWTLGCGNHNAHGAWKLLLSTVSSIYKKRCWRRGSTRRPHDYQAKRVTTELWRIDERTTFRVPLYRSFRAVDISNTCFSGTTWYLFVYVCTRPFAVTLVLSVYPITGSFRQPPCLGLGCDLTLGYRILSRIVYSTSQTLVQYCTALRLRLRQYNIVREFTPSCTVSFT